jgi:hypothetical protein
VKIPIEGGGLIDVPPGVNETLFKVALEFMGFTHKLFGAYLDALGGLRLLRKQVVDFQNATIADLKQKIPAQATEAFMDTQPLSHEFEATTMSPEMHLHQSSQGEFKKRTALDGRDARLLGYMMVALLYGAWEDVYRLKFALALGHSEKNAVQSELFRDLAKIRHAIVHNAGIATEAVEQSQKLIWFQRGDLMFSTTIHVDNLYHDIDCYITELCSIPKEFRMTGPL